MGEDPKVRPAIDRMVAKLTNSGVPAEKAKQIAHAAAIRADKGANR